MNANETIVAEGVLLDVAPNRTGRVRMANGHEVHAFLPEKVRGERIPLLPGEKVVLEISPYDLSKGRITLGKN